MPNDSFAAFVPSDEWHHRRVHWHAHVETRTDAPRTGHRASRLASEPYAILRTPHAVALWIDEQTRKHVLHAETWVSQEGLWVSIGDTDDLAHLREENYLIAARGDSIYTDIYTNPQDQHHDLYVEAVTDAQCRHGCSGPAFADASEADPS